MKLCFRKERKAKSQQKWTSESGEKGKPRVDIASLLDGPAKIKKAQAFLCEMKNPRAMTKQKILCVFLANFDGAAACQHGAQKFSHGEENLCHQDAYIRILSLLVIVTKSPVRFAVASAGR